MEIKVPKKCDRCGRTEDVLMSQDELAGLVELTNKKADELKRIIDFGETLDPEAGPSVILFVKDDTGSYSMKHLDVLCARPDAQRNKGCTVRVQELVSDIFDLKKDTEKKERKPRAKKEKPVKTEEE